MLQSTRERKRSTTQMRKVARRFNKMEYTIREAAELRRVHPLTVRRKIRSGEIVAHLEVDEQLRSVIYKIPVAELEKIKAEPGKRTDLV